MFPKKKLMIAHIDKHAKEGIQTYRSGHMVWLWALCFKSTCQGHWPGWWNSSNQFHSRSNWKNWKHLTWWRKSRGVAIAVFKCLKGSPLEQGWEAVRNEAINPDNKLGRCILAKHKDELWNSYVCPEMDFPFSVNKKWYQWEFPGRLETTDQSSTESSPSTLTFTLSHFSHFYHDFKIIFKSILCLSHLARDCLLKSPSAYPQPRRSVSQTMFLVWLKEEGTR